MGDLASHLEAGAQGASRYLKAPELARVSGIRYRTIRAAITSGELRSARLGGVDYVRLEWLDEWAERVSKSAASTAARRSPDLAPEAGTASRRPGKKRSSAGARRGLGEARARAA